MPCPHGGRHNLLLLKCGLSLLTSFLRGQYVKEGKQLHLVKPDKHYLTQVSEILSTVLSHAGRIGPVYHVMEMILFVYAVNPSQIMRKLQTNPNCTHSRKSLSSGSWQTALPGYPEFRGYHVQLLQRVDPNLLPCWGKSQLNELHGIKEEQGCLILFFFTRIENNPPVFRSTGTFIFKSTGSLQFSTLSQAVM